MALRTDTKPRFLDTTHSLAQHETTRTQTPRDVDTTDQTRSTSKKTGTRRKKFHEQQVPGEPGLVCWRSGRRARSCGAPALVSAVSNTQAQPNASGRGAHLQQQVTKALVRDGVGGC